MAGIYIHIPFCKRRCTYCDFYTEIAPKLIPATIDSIAKELYIRKDYLQNSQINTIYFGGGTPSILNREDFNTIFDAINVNNIVDKNAEITFEANPDDIDSDFLASIQGLPFNRISIGIQSFDNVDLKRINRRHTGEQAIEAVKAVQNAGLGNISIDLIYGLPYQTLESWEKQVETALSLNVQHISSYGLTYEEGTMLYKQRENGKIIPVDEDTMIEMYKLLIRKIEQKGYKAYEISNFCLPGFESKHNTSYWKQQPYLGIGPSAHSYDLNSRQWNIASINKYSAAIENNTTFYEIEELSLNNRYNDFVMVTLRTSAGLNVVELEEKFGVEYSAYCLENIKRYIDTKKVEITDGKLRLTADGIQITNLILIDLMKV